MKDIFEIIRHEDVEKHELEVVEFDNGFLLGCKTCGQTLLSTDDLQGESKYLELIKTLKDRGEKSNKLLELVIMIGRLALEPNEKDYDAFISKIKRDIKSKIESNTRNNHGALYNSFLISSLYNEIIDRYRQKQYNIVYDILASHIYEDPAGELLKITKQVIKRLKREENQKEEVEYKFYSYDTKKWPVAGCHEYKIGSCYKKEASILITILKEMEALEKECPTPCDVYTFKDMDDYYDKMPSWDNEENEDAIFREYNYRIKNDLFDFSNIDTQNIINNCIETFESYDYMERYTATLKKLILNK